MTGRLQAPEEGFGPPSSQRAGQASAPGRRACPNPARRRSRRRSPVLAVSRRCRSPHVWAGRHDHRAGLGGPLASRAQAGLIVCGPDRDWVPFLAAADAAVIDHSSLGLYYALLARPTVAVPVRDRAVNPAAPVAVLRALSPAVTGGGDLAAAVRAAAGRFDPAAFAACRRGLTAYRGQAAARTQAVLYELLGRPVPGHHPPPGAA